MTNNIVKALSILLAPVRLQWGRMSPQAMVCVDVYPEDMVHLPDDHEW